MKVFIDTNVFADFIECRNSFESAKEIFHQAEDKAVELYMSNGSLYTLTYISERALKKMGVHRPEQTEKIRLILNNFLNIVHLVSISHEGAGKAIKDSQFDDIEDSFQYHCALENKCDYLITINIKDFKKAKQDKIKILLPEDFLKL